MRRYYVYELVNLMGSVEYVGQTVNPERRFYAHTKEKPRNGCGNGKFYNRQDLTIHIVKSFQTKEEALAFEGELKLSYGFEWTEKTCVSKAGKIGGKIGGKIVGKKTGPINGKIPSRWLRKLTFEDAEVIRQLYATGCYFQYELAEMYSLTQSSIYNIIKNKTYTEP